MEKKKRKKNMKLRSWDLFVGGNDITAPQTEPYGNETQRFTNEQ